MTFPVDIDGINDSLAVLDPARDRLLELFATAIESELGAAWTKVTGALPQGSAFAGSSVVADKLPLRPSAQLMQERKTKFPLLCLHREGSEETQPFTLNEDRVQQQWQLHYILGPGDVEVERKILDVCHAIGALVKLVVRQRGHKDYDGGALQFFPESGALESVRVLRKDGPGQATFVDDGSVTLWACTWTLETIEAPSDNPEAFGQFQAADVTINAGDGSGTNVYPALIIAQTDAN